MSYRTATYPAPSWESLNVIDRETAQLDVQGTAAETTFYSVTIPGGTLGVDRGVFIHIVADHWNDTGVSQSFTPRFKYGGATMFDDATQTLADAGASPPRRSVIFEAWLYGYITTGAQLSQMTMRISNATAPTAGIGDIGATGGGLGVIHGTSSVDSTVNQTLELTIQHSASSASLSLRRLYAKVIRA